MRLPTPLFKLSDYTGLVIEDLFGEDSYFADADLFWALQGRAIAAERDALLKAGWGEVVVLETGQRFAPYEHVKMPKKKGGKVFITISHDGEVQFFEGFLTRKEARKLEKVREREAGGTAGKSPAARPAITKAMENYLDLHRHALARLALIGNPQVAWRLAVAHMVAPSGNWTVNADPQTKASLAKSAGQAAFEDAQEAAHRLLGWDTDDTCESTASVFTKLLILSDEDVLHIAAFFMAASLAAGSEVVEDVGQSLRIDPLTHWQPDDTFFDLVRDRATVNAMLAEVAGEEVAKANIAERPGPRSRSSVIASLGPTGGRRSWTGFPAGWPSRPAHTEKSSLRLLQKQGGDADCRRVTVRAAASAAALLSGVLREAGFRR